MNTSKQERLDKIMKILTEANKSLTTSEIFEKLKLTSETIPSRKTIERDVHELVKKNVVFECSQNPLEVAMTGQYGIVMHLTHEEITYLMVVLPETHPLNIRLRKSFG